jgi:hypothetical protein
MFVQQLLRIFVFFITSKKLNFNLLENKCSWGPQKSDSRSRLHRDNAAKMLDIVGWVTVPAATPRRHGGFRSPPLFFMSMSLAVFGEMVTPTGQKAAQPTLRLLFSLRLCAFAREKRFVAHLASKSLLMKSGLRFPSPNPAKAGDGQSMGHLRHQLIGLRSSFAGNISL